MWQIVNSPPSAAWGQGVLSRDPFDVLTRILS